MNYIKIPLGVQRLTIAKKSCDALPTIVQPLHDYRGAVARTSWSRCTIVVKPLHDYQKAVFKKLSSYFAKSVLHFSFHKFLFHQKSVKFHKCHIAMHSVYSTLHL